MNKKDFLNQQKNGGVKVGESVLRKSGRPTKPDSEKFTEKVTITLTQSQFKNAEKNIGHDRNKTVVLRDILQKSGILSKRE